MSLTPKNWHDFQHYKDRKPAWIKLHHSLLDDFEFSRLPVASRALAPCLWLLASEYEGGAITASLEEIAFRLRMTVDELVSSVQPLIKSGFFDDASGLLADGYQDAIPEREKRTRIEEVEIEGEKTHARGARAPDWPPDYRSRFWEAFPNKIGKGDALKKLDRLATQGGVKFSDLMKALSRYANKTDDRPFCNPATWINQERWTDQPRAGPSRKPTLVEATDSLLAKMRMFDEPAPRICDGTGENTLRRIPSK